MKLYNTLTRKLEGFIPIKKDEVGVYSCGPTVYWNQTIGNMYAFLSWDFLVRSLRFLGYRVKWVMNITDVGHMTSNEDTGEDKMEKGARREGKSVWDVANQYIGQFKESLQLLNITTPDVLPRATEHINEQIELIQRIEKNGFTYKTKTGVVFDTLKFAGYADFARLNLDEQYAGSRVEIDPEKKKPWDFLLWVTNQPNHIMLWDSPWGKGFPGWHIECTAMSVKYLGEQFDIHTGGKEHIPVHHTNEVAQGFGAFGHQTANFWLHNEWLTLKEGKMGKSLGNAYTMQDLVEKKFDPLAFRYLVLTSHYRSGLNFTWESLEAAQTGLNRLYEIFSRLPQDKKTITAGGEKWEQKFIEAISDDLGISQALALAWKMLKSDLDEREKYNLLLKWDRVLGLKLDECTRYNLQCTIPEEVQKLVEERETLRKAKKWDEADEVRKEINGKGYLIEDTLTGFKISKKS